MQFATYIFVIYCYQCDKLVAYYLCVFGLKRLNVVCIQNETLVANGY
jgi:hypothetical protein